jgi:hypothetical protein
MPENKPKERSFVPQLFPILYFVKYNLIVTKLRSLNFSVISFSTNRVGALHLSETIGAAQQHGL